MQVAQLSVDQMGNPLQRIRYEDLVAAPQIQLKALLGFLSLEWNESVLDYRQEAGSRASNTPSYQQVSQPLYARSIGRWLHYQKQLEPWLAVLRPWMKSLGYPEQNVGDGS